MSEADSNTQKVRKGRAMQRTETSIFLQRALVFLRHLQRRRYPNATTLAEKCGCSRSTAVRTIDRLRYEFGVPIEYDESERGYYLTNPSFSLFELIREDLEHLTKMYAEILRDVEK